MEPPKSSSDGQTVFAVIMGGFLLSIALVFTVITIMASNGWKWPF